MGPMDTVIITAFAIYTLGHAMPLHIKEKGKQPMLGICAVQEMGTKKSFHDFRKVSQFSAQGPRYEFLYMT